MRQLLCTSFFEFKTLTSLSSPPYHVGGWGLPARIVKAGDRISLSGTSPNGQFRSAITTETGNTSTENAGNITLDTEQLSMSDGAYILASTFGSSGSIFIDTVRLDLDNQAGISVASFGSGEGGQIQVRAETLKLNDRSLISAQTETTNGGDKTGKVLASAEQCLDYNRPTTSWVSGDESIICANSATSGHT